MHPRWMISESQVKSAAAFALDDGGFAVRPPGLSRLHFYYRFRWAEFERLPFWSPAGEARRLDSHLGVTLDSVTLFLQPTFVFPAPWYAETLRDFIAGIEKTVPFRFRDQYFKRSIPSKSGNGRLLNLPKDWRKAMLEGKAW